MMNTSFDHCTATENEILRDEARQRADKVADDLASLSERIRAEASQFTNSSRPAAAVAADIVSTYVQSGNAIGAAFWGMIRDLSRMQ